jgi:hypothetical protein
LKNIEHFLAFIISEPEWSEPSELNMYSPGLPKEGLDGHEITTIYLIRTVVDSAVQNVTRKSATDPERTNLAIQDINSVNEYTERGFAVILASLSYITQK